MREFSKDRAPKPAPGDSAGAWQNMGMGIKRCDELPRAPDKETLNSFPFTEDTNGWAQFANAA
jgi:hypothetical protein